MKRRSGIRACFEEGFYAQIWITLTSGKFLTDLALTFGAASFHLGLINAIPFLAAPAQLLGAYLCTLAGSRKAVLLPAVFISRQLWWIVLALVLLPLRASDKIWVFILLLAIGNVAAQVSGNAWLSWLSDLIPDRARGRVISTRNGLLIMLGLGADFIMSQVREQLGPERHTLFLALALGLAAFMATKTIYVFRQQWEPPKARETVPPLSEVWRESINNRGVRRLLRALVLWNAAVGIAISFWAPHMMTYLEMSFTDIFFYTLMVTVVSFIMSSAVWGPVIDRAGNLSVVLFCAAIIVFFPFLWLTPTPGRFNILYFEAFLNGIAWSGFNVAIFNLPFDILPQKHRSYFFAILSAASGLALGIGALAGGVVAQALEGMRVEFLGITWINFHVTFVLSAVLRFCCLFLLWKIPDSRSRGVVFTIQAVGDGLVRIMTNPRLLLVSVAPITRPRRQQVPTKPRTAPAKPGSRGGRPGQ